MPSFNDMKKLHESSGTIGQQVKRMSDYAMEATWDNNIQSKLCYIYDYAHDDHPELATDIPHSRNTMKTPIDAKFIVTKYWTVSSDQPEYHIEFKPGQPLRFRESDPLYYYETDYLQKYGMSFPVGMYIDIPDESGVYEKWLIYGKHGGNQFTKFSVLKCDYYLHWVEFIKNIRIKRKMWCVLRSQSSYNSGSLVQLAHYKSL